MFVEKTYTYQKIFCDICGAPTQELRNQIVIPTWALRFPGHEEIRDFFFCPHEDDDWHKQASYAKQEAARAISRRSKDRFRRDLFKILRKNPHHGQPPGMQYKIVYPDLLEMKNTIQQTGKLLMSVCSDDYSNRRKQVHQGIYLYDHRYYYVSYSYDDDQDLYDYDGLKDAFLHTLSFITQFTRMIECSFLSREFIKQQLVWGPLQSHTILINGEPEKVGCNP